MYRRPGSINARRRKAKLMDQVMGIKEGGVYSREDISKRLTYNGGFHLPLACRRPVADWSLGVEMRDYEDVPRRIVGQRRPVYTYKIREWHLRRNMMTFLRLIGEVG